MQLVITGIHQRTTPVALREQLAFADADLPAALQALREQAIEACVLSTCNRVEIYATMEDDADPQALAHFLADWHHVDRATVLPHTTTLVGEAAVQHVFRLAAGLDSMVLGEEQITSQIRSAVQAASDAGALGAHLRRMIDNALTAGKLVRTNTGIARLNLSVVSVAVDLARQRFGTLAGRRVLVVGAGRMAELAIKHLHGIAHVTVANRTAARAEALAQRYGVQSAPYAALPQLLAAHDVAICCTSAPDVVLTAAQVAEAAAHSPQVLLDLAVPRDIDPAAIALENVTLFDVDHMQAICASNREARAAEVSAAEDVVRGEVAKFMDWWATQRIVPTIRALRERAEAIRAAELERTLARLPNLGPSEQAAISALSAAIVNKLLHSPITSLKNPSEADELAHAVQRLFQL
ncbi:glutamyl-tRNA reductase [Chloroflexia bacterium SDU3-3]|nr:glutamyl-tRNA reductase [Chloroflexia bacterium SDU3-3]